MEVFLNVFRPRPRPRPSKKKGVHRFLSLQRPLHSKARASKTLKLSLIHSRYIQTLRNKAKKQSKHRKRRQKMRTLSSLSNQSFLILLLSSPVEPEQRRHVHDAQRLRRRLAPSPAPRRRSGGSDRRSCGRGRTAAPYRAGPRRGQRRDCLFYGALCGEAVDSLLEIVSWF